MPIILHVSSLHGHRLPFSGPFPTPAGSPSQVAQASLVSLPPTWVQEKGENGRSLASEKERLVCLSTSLILSCPLWAPSAMISAAGCPYLHSATWAHSRNHMAQFPALGSSGAKQAGAGGGSHLLPTPFYHCSLVSGHAVLRPLSLHIPLKNSPFSQFSPKLHQGQSSSLDTRSKCFPLQCCPVLAPTPPGFCHSLGYQADRSIMPAWILQPSTVP